MSAAKQQWVGVAFLVACVIAATLLLREIYFAETSILATSIDQIVGGDSVSSAPVPAELADARATIVTNERLLEMTKWTISLVLTTGGLLIGFSWVQSSSNLARDQKQLGELREETRTKTDDILSQFSAKMYSIDSHDKRLDDLESNIRQIASIQSNPAGRESLATPSLLGILRIPEDQRWDIIYTEIDQAGANGDVLALLEWVNVGQKLLIRVDDDYEFYPTFQKLSTSFYSSTIEALSLGTNVNSVPKYSRLTNHDLHRTLLAKLSDEDIDSWMETVSKIQDHYNKDSGGAIMVFSRPAIESDDDDAPF